MIKDILTVIWKESKGMLHNRGSRTRFLVILIAPLFLSVIFPLEHGTAWVKNLDSVFLAVFFPIILVSITIPDSFAGERERHTLQTLLASRLSDRAILIGKFAISVAFAWGMSLVSIILGMVVVNVSHWEGQLLLLTPTLLITDVVVSFLLATLAAASGVLISLRSQTVQEAMQTLTAVVLMPPMLLGLLLTIMSDQVREIVGNLNSEQILLVVVFLLIVVDLIVFFEMLTRFRRSQMYLE